MRIAAAAARRNKREAQRAEREKAIAKAAEKAKINEMLALLRPLRSFAVKDNSELDTLNLLRPPQMLGVATEYISDDGSLNSDKDAEGTEARGGSARKAKAALILLLSEVGILPAVFDFVTAGDVFRNRLWCKSFRRLVSQMPLNLRVSKNESLALCVFLREASEGGGTALFPFQHLKGLHLSSLTERHVKNLTPAITYGAFEKLSTLHVAFTPTEGLLGINLFFGAIDERPPPRLRTLDLTGSYLGDEGFQLLANIFQSGSCNSIEHLLLGQNGCSDRGARKLFAALGNPRCEAVLKTLDLARNNIEDDGARILFKALRKPALSSLRTLNACGNQFSCVAVASELVPSVTKRGCIKWRTINLSQNAIGDQGLVPLFEGLTDNIAGCFYGLQKCALSSTELGDATVDALSEVIQSGMLQKLTSIDLSYNWIHASGMRALGAALTRHSLPRLKVLNLANNHGGDEGIDHLSVALQLGGCRVLQVLDISFNQGNRCMQHLAMVIKKNCCPSLRELVITGNAPPHIRPHRLFKGVKGLNTR